MSVQVLTDEIIKLSESHEWSEAKTEWRLKEVHINQLPAVCLCGHAPIYNICTLVNILNETDVEVGNCCVQKFMGIASNNIFNGIKRIMLDPKNALNAAGIDYVVNRGWLNEYEHGFLVNTKNKRKMSEKQMAKRKQINAKMVLLIVRR